MLDWQIEAVRNAFRDATWETVVEERKRYTKRTGTVAEEMRELLQTILEEKLAEEDQQPSASEWSAQKAAKEKPKPLTAKEKEAQREREARRLTRDGTVVPFTTPESPYKKQTDYDQARRMTLAEYKAFVASQKAPRD